MGNQIYSAEFKEEAVRQIFERQYSVQEFSDRSGISTHSLYKWVKAVKPDQSELSDDALLEAKREVLKLKAESVRVKEECDILKKVAAHFAKNSG